MSRGQAPDHVQVNGRKHPALQSRLGEPVAAPAPRQRHARKGKEGEAEQNQRPGLGHIDQAPAVGAQL